MTQATILNNRGVLKLSGKDKAPFLQGLITNDVHKILPNQPIYAALLSPQGKFQYDLFISQIQDDWYIDCDLDRADMLLKRLSLYKLRSDVTLGNVSDQFVVGVMWGIDGSDPRLMELGSRIILSKDKVASFFESEGYHVTSFEEYDYHRIKLGVPDGERDVLIDRGILLECGFDELNAIDWQKGCFMGQELTARTRYRGLVRKRLVPVHILGVAPAYQTPIFQGEHEVGELRSAQNDWGIAMIRNEALHKSLPFTCGGATVTPHIPQWMHLPSLDDEA
jgi:hypothetical protein